MKPLAQNTLIQNRYLIVHLIGKGGMGEVYLAVDQRLGSAVALKRTFFAGDEMLGSAFEREAKILARMRHPALPKVSDHFTENQEQYLIMEHIAGDDLARRLELAGKPFPVSWVLFWADQLLDALSYLHSHEPPIIHRDIKPQNLKLTDENYIILLDFGLSKSSTGKTHLPSGKSTGSSGSTGSVVGYTPHYAPMEQIRGIGTNARSDIYSLSATLYQLLTNTVPPDALTRADALLNGSADPLAPPHELNPEVPHSVSNVILKGMEVSQDRRFGSAREMQRELRQAFTKLQEVMSAKTVAFNAQAEGLGMLEQPAAAPQQTPSLPTNSNSFPTGNQVPENLEPLDMEATLAFDPNANSSLSKQSEIKTEVFNSGGPAIPSNYTTPAPPVPSGELPDAGTFTSPASHTSGGFESAPPASEGPQTTSPIYSFDDRSAEVSSPLAPVETGFYSSAETQERRDAYATVTGGEPAMAASASSVASVPGYAPDQARPARASSSRKALALLGGLAVFFVLVLGAAAGGWYAYQRYNAVSVEATPSPTPEAVLEPSPEPTPAFEISTETNSSDNTNSLTATDTNSAQELPTSGPTPEAGMPETGSPGSTQGTRGQRTAPRQTQPPAGERPVKVAPTPTAPKPTPKPKTDDRTVILQ